MASQRYLQIPKPHHGGLVKLINLPTDKLRALEAALEKAPATLYREDLIQRVEKETGIDADDLREIMTVIVALYAVRYYPGIKTDHFVDDIVSAAKTDIEDLKNEPGEVDWDALKSYLTRILNFETTIGVTAKAYEVLGENQRNYCAPDTRMVTDIRPVFAGEQVQRPAAAVIVHSLKICYHENGRHQEFFLALDNSDLKHLKGVLDRAEKKAKLMEEVVSSSNMQLLESDRSDLL